MCRGCVGFVSSNCNDIQQDRLAGSRCGTGRPAASPGKEIRCEGCYSDSYSGGVIARTWLVSTRGSHTRALFEHVLWQRRMGSRSDGRVRKLVYMANN